MWREHSQRVRAEARCVVRCRRMRDDLQQLREKTMELEIKMDRVRVGASSTDSLTVP